MLAHLYQSFVDSSVIWIISLAGLIFISFMNRMNIVNWLLTTFNGGVLRNGKAISGPAYTWPNGQFADKFLNGRAKSEEWRQYGPVYRIWAGPKPEIVLSTPEDLKIFHSDSANHGKPLDGNFGWFFGQVLGRCVGLLEHDEWKRFRKVVDPSFNHGAAVKSIGACDESAREFVDSLESTFSSKDSKGDLAASPSPSSSFTVHAATAFMKFPFFYTAGIVYGKLSPSEETELWAIAEQRLDLLPYFFKGSFYRTSYLKFWDRPAHKQLQDFLQAWTSFNERMAISRRHSDPTRPIVSYWDEYQSGASTLEQIIHTLDEMLFANLDVTTHVMTWAITLIASHEDVKAKLREEISQNTEDLRSYIARSDTHLHRCYYESMRVRPITLFSIGEYSPVAKDFRGILVKPGTMVLVDTLGINIRNPFWGSNSESFVPDRFKSVKQSDLRYNLYVFGFGHRKCLGQHVAGHMIKAVCTHLFSKYDVTVNKGRKDQNEYEIDKSSWVPMADVNLQVSKLE